MEQLVLVLSAVAALLVVVLVVFAARRWYLTRVRGSFDCSVRVPSGPGGLAPGGAGGPARRGSEGPWSLGVARFGSERVAWWKVFSLSPRPGCTWQRDDLAVLERRWPAEGEADSVLPDAVVVRCTHRGRPLDLAMTQEAYTGFASWLEAGPPGPRSRVT